MDHSPEESELFQALAETFDIYNPRKLLRLRNSYRLLKLFDLQFSLRSPDHQRFAVSLLMVSLFWQEFLSACAPENRQACVVAVESNDPKKAAQAERAVIGGFLRKLDQHPDWRDELVRAEDFVRRLVLPRGDKWTSRANTAQG